MSGQWKMGGSTGARNKEKVLNIRTQVYHLNESNQARPFLLYSSVFSYFLQIFKGPELLVDLQDFDYSTGPVEFRFHVCQNGELLPLRTIFLIFGHLCCDMDAHDTQSDTYILFSTYIALFHDLATVPFMVVCLKSSMDDQ